jgi:hypothetical protein
MGRELTDRVEGADSFPAAAFPTLPHPEVLSIPVTLCRYRLLNS